MLFNMSRNEFKFFLDQFFADEIHFTAAFVAVPCRSVQQVILCEHRKLPEQLLAGILLPLMGRNFHFLNFQRVLNIRVCALFRLIKQTQLFSGGFRNLRNQLFAFLSKKRALHILQHDLQVRNAILLFFQIGFKGDDVFLNIPGQMIHCRPVQAHSPPSVDILYIRHSEGEILLGN